MNEHKGETVDEFFNKLPIEDKEIADVFDEKTTEKVETKVEKTEETDEDGRKNRRHRRLEEQLQRERDSNIALNERLKVLSEQDRFAEDVKIDSRIAKMFDSSDQGKENALRLAEVLGEMTEKAKEKALYEIEEKRKAKVTEQREYESFIDNELESLEDKFNVDLTSDAPKARKTRREFLELVGSLSPKDESGNLMGYADFNTAFELYKKTVTEEKVDNSRREEIAARSMQRSTSSSSSSSTKKITPGFDGWRKDFGLE